MLRLHIIGRKNSGKTTLVVELVERLTERGLRVGTIKHTHHRHELDTPGKDSFRHRQAGSHAVGILSPQMNALFWPQDQTPETTDPLTEQEPPTEEGHEARYQLFQALMDDCDLLLVEGDSQTRAPKIEVWRAETNTPPMYEEDQSIVAMVTDDIVTDDRATDDTPPVHPTLFPRTPIDALVEWILQQK